MSFIWAQEIYNIAYIFTAGAGIILSLYRWDRGWMAKESVFNSQEGQEIFLFSIASKPAEAYPASCPMGTGDTFP
jgi:hypothetical protein